MMAGRDVTFRYRVGAVAGGGEDWASLHDVREFRTLRAAERYQEELTKAQPFPVLLQVGVVYWTSYEDAQARVEKAVSDGWRLQ